MGQPKQLLEWGKGTLLDHAIKSVLKLNSEEAIVVLGANYDRIEKGIRHLPITVLNNKEWELGLGKSIACGANYILKSTKEFDGILITLADQPHIDNNFLNTLIDSFVAGKKQIVATKYEDGKQGVPVLFDSIYLEELANLKDDKGAKSLLIMHKNRVKTVSPPTKNIDLDTEEDYREQYRLKFKK
jgi:molybdenum cofactor cytidylyltransferase